MSKLCSGSMLCGIFALISGVLAGPVSLRAELVRCAWAEEPEPQSRGSTASVATARAADLYDQATQLYERAAYSEAAQAFLQADALVPSSEAVWNAIVSARRAQAHLLVAEAAERAISREQVDGDLAARARAALAEAEPYLARLRVRCKPAPCTVFLNGQPLKDPQAHLLPGSYELSAAADNAAPSEPAREQFKAEAGAEYSYVLDVTATPKPASLVPMPAQPTAQSPSDRQHASERPLPQWVFYIGAATTGVLTGITVWSGLSTLAAKHNLPPRDAPGYATATDNVYSKARRTDWLLGTTLVTATATAAAAVLWVDWGSRTPVQLSAAVRPRGGELRLGGQF